MAKDYLSSFTGPLQRPGTESFRFPEYKQPMTKTLLPALVPKSREPDPFIREGEGSAGYGVWTGGDYTGLNVATTSETQLRRLTDAFNNGLMLDKPVVTKGSTLTVSDLEKKGIAGLYVRNDLDAEGLKNANSYIASMATANFSVKDMFEARNDHIEACTVTALAWFLTKYDQMYAGRRSSLKPVPAL